MPKDLKVPADVIAADAQEIIRVWVGEEGSQFFLLGNVWDDPAAFGILMADLIRHYAQASEVPQNKLAEFIERVLDGLRVEIESPTG